MPIWDVPSVDDLSACGLLNTNDCDVMSALVMTRDSSAVCL